MYSIDDLHRIILLQHIEERGMTPAEVSTEIRGSKGARNYLGRKLRGDQRLPIEDIAAVSEYLGVTAEEFAVALLERVAPHRLASEHDGKTEYSPSHYARLLLKRTLRKITSQERIEIEAAVPESFFEPIPLEASAALSQDWKDLLEEIDKHPTVALDLARRKALRSAASPPAGSGEILQHSSFLHAWAVAALRIGRINYAGVLSAKALQLHGDARYSATYPPLLRAVGAVFHELGEPSLAISTARNCLLKSYLIEDEVGQCKSALALSSRLSVAHLAPEAICILGQLRSVPEELHFRVQYALAFLHFHQGETDRAEELISRSGPTSNYERLYRLHLLAKITAARGSTDSALERYEALITESTGHFQPSHRLMIFLEMVPILRQQKASVIRLFAARFYEDLERLELNKAARGLRKDVLDAATRGVLREGLEHAYKRPIAQDI